MNKGLKSEIAELEVKVGLSHKEIDRNEWIQTIGKLEALKETVEVIEEKIEKLRYRKNLAIEKGFAKEVQEIIEIQILVLEELL